MRRRRRTGLTALPALLALLLCACPEPDIEPGTVVIAERPELPSAASAKASPSPTTPAEENPALAAPSPSGQPDTAPSTPPTAGQADPPTPEATPREDKASPQAAEAPPELDRTSRQALTRTVLDAARAKDFDALGELMDREFYFEGPMGEQPMTREAALRRWRAQPALLDRLVALLEGPCASTRSTWECPSSMIEREEYGNAERLSFSLVDKEWRWNVFISD